VLAGVKTQSVGRRDQVERAAEHEEEADQCGQRHERVAGTRE
jgi:hypothetical protein